MILVTVGMQLGFDRLIEAMDALAPGLETPVVAQIGRGSYVPQNMEAHTSIPPQDFEAMVAASKVIVSHAGIGSVLTAARHSKPIVLFPRRASLGEHRNDHQLATVANLSDRPGILVAETEGDLKEQIYRGLAYGEVSYRASHQADALNRAVAQFIETGAL